MEGTMMQTQRQGTWYKNYYIETYPRFGGVIATARLRPDGRIIHEAGGNLREIAILKLKNRIDSYLAWRDG